VRDEKLMDRRKQVAMDRARGRRARLTMKRMKQARGCSPWNKRSEA